MKCRKLLITLSLLLLKNLLSLRFLNLNLNPLDFQPFRIFRNLRMH